ncbi:MAG TPA: hypothetical protein VGB67_01875 [Fibrella sp.]|jgi:hypothetical protein
MRIAPYIRIGITASCLLFITTLSFAQYGGGYGGGQYGGGMGRSMGGMGSMGNGPDFKPQLPNIAGDMANKETKWMKENLGLTKEQGKSIKTLNNDYAKIQQEAIKEILGTDGGRSNPEAGKQVRDAMMMYNEEKEDKFKAILTPEQWVSYQTKKPDMQREIGGVRPPAPAGMVLKKDSTTTVQAKQ